ncbi:MAG: transcription repressor NadR [Treponema sp.]|nr:transcription repressor NadR [Treponema sp.]
MRGQGEERRSKILEFLSTNTSPVSGNQLARKFNVSRQVIVTDIALLRAIHPELISTTAGYVLNGAGTRRRIFKMNHSDEQTEDELTCITDLGGTVLDVFVEHKVYGTIRAPLRISSKRDVQNFINDLRTSVSTPLKNITQGYHYHTISARSEAVLNEIERELKSRGYLIQTQAAAPVYQAKQYNA